MTIGYDKPLYLLPFDHRQSYVKGLFDFGLPLSAQHSALVRDSKQLIYEGFRQALAEGISPEFAGILVDEEFGGDILRDARQRNFVTAVSTERSGCDEFEFEYGADFASHIEAVDPTFAKALVRYNPEGDAALNLRQVQRLKMLSDHCRRNQRRFMFEMLVPATAEQLAREGGDKAAYERHLRPILMCMAIRELQKAGVEPDVWKVEGVRRHDDCERIVEAARHDGRGAVGCIVLGRGADAAKVRRWLATAAKVDGFIGFAVGRTSFWDAVAAYRAQTMTRSQAVLQVARRLREWVDIFETARLSRGLRAGQMSPIATSDVARSDLLCINTLRTLSIDAVQQANSGHPGTPMGAAPTAYCLWQRFLRYDPNDPEWPNRDRFVLSVGHASALLYSLLYLCGVRAAGPSYEGEGQRTGGLAVTLADLRSFRQAGSRCTGHPEYGWTSGVETTTGPLGQGVATSVGMAAAEAWLAATYNRPGRHVFDYNVYALCGDGDMMEGISSEAASLAGHLKLANLCWIYDANHISIEGSTAITFSEDVGARFEAFGWQVLHVADANDLERLTRALQAFVDTHDRPTLIIVQSHIGYGAPHKQDTKEAHGEPLGVDEIRLAKMFYGFDPDAQFVVPDGVREHFSAQFGQRGASAREAWNGHFAAYRTQFPDLAAQIDRMQRGELPDGWDSALPSFAADTKGLATRDASGRVLNAIAQQMPWLLGGAADLSPSTKTSLVTKHARDFGPPSGDGAGGDYGGRNLHFGVREHAMCAFASGMALSKLRPFAASFFIFTDYCRGAIRLSAMMGVPVIYIWTHDSIGMGEDGPTHQPIEQLASFRAMPGMLLLRPADANEVVEAWRVVMQFKLGPASLVLSRQALPTLDRTKYASASGVARGAYVLADVADGRPDVLLLATGSEVALCVAAYEQLTSEGIRVRVVSMPSWDLFEGQSAEYRDSVLPPAVAARVSVEAAAMLGWERYVGRSGTIIGMRSFGISAPGGVGAAHFGFDAAHVCAAAREQLTRHAPTV